MSTEPVVVAEEVCARYGQLEALRGISLTVNPGEVVCLVGPSGSGKSTLLRCVNHLHPISAGKLTVAGEPVGYRQRGNRLHELSPREVAKRRERIGMVFQRFNLFPHMTVLGNIIEAPVRVKRVPKAVAYAEAMTLLERVGLQDRADSYPEQLSGGQQQRVAIARALAMKPMLMLFDEPTSALDPELVGEVLDVMGKLVEDGMTMLVVTHEIGFARQAADVIAFMDNGQVIEAGPPEQLLAAPEQERTRSFLARVTV